MLRTDPPGENRTAICGMRERRRETRTDERNVATFFYLGAFVGISLLREKREETNERSDG